MKNLRKEFKTDMKKQKSSPKKRFQDKDIEHFCQSVNTILTKINERCASKARRETAS